MDPLVPTVNECPHLGAQNLKRASVSAAEVRLGHGYTALVRAAVAQVGVTGERSVWLLDIELNEHGPALVFEAVRPFLSVHGLSPPYA
ncbi:hypothetical protein J7E62_07620 [Variovorax paradoxus]|nr:hypothetical protein [Variovorax paradoxus]